MIRIRPYKAADANTILSWCQDEIAFYKWTAGVLGNYPITQNEFRSVESLMPFTAFDETGIVGFFTLRNPNESLDELCFGRRMEVQGIDDGKYINPSLRD